MSEAPQNGVQSLEIGIGVFRALLAFRRAASLSEIADGAHMHPSKVHRYLVSLVRSGLVAQDSRGQYRLGPLVAQIAETSAGPHPALETASNGLDLFAAQIKQTSFLSVWFVSGPQVVRIVEPESPVSLRPTTRGELPLWNSATARIFMAYMDTERVASLLDAEAKRDREVHGVSPAETQRRRKLALEQIALARKHRVARTTGERQVGLVSFAAPVFASGDVPVLAISVIGIEAALSPNWDGPVPKELRAFALSVSAQIGGLA
ncbi:MAG: IclR family transcriptional regulator [Comamonadaceae bacterium]|nr:MAG: IclR family transcriptional regulator [Comamonadaceae bacterium]